MASTSDRGVYALPNYRAMPWPAATGPDHSLEHHDDPNNMHHGRSSINASEFMEPFVEGHLPDRPITRPAYRSAGTSFAGSGNILASEAASFAGSELPHSSLLHEQLASSIKMDFDQTPAVSPLETVIMSDPPSITTIKASTEIGKNTRIYGAATTTTTTLASSVFDRIAQAIRGATYDLAHFGDIQAEHLDREECNCKLSYVFTRDGRMPYLCVIFFALMFLIILFVIIAGGGDRESVRYYHNGYYH